MNNGIRKSIRYAKSVDNLTANINYPFHKDKSGRLIIVIL